MTNETPASTPTRGPQAASPASLLSLVLLTVVVAGCVTAPPAGDVAAQTGAPVTTAAPSAVASTGVAPAASAAASATGVTSIDSAAAATAASTDTTQAIPSAAEGASAPAPTPIDPLQPEVRLDLDSRAARVDLWQRVRNGFAMVDLDNELVRERERYYATRPDYVARMTARGGRYLFHIVEELAKRGMPTELALLPFIESAFNPQAMSVARASGMWQFIPSTGRDFELTQNVFRDDRRSVLDSTRAALDYLQKLHNMFGDWQLALAAYNWGEGSVQRAMARNRASGLPTDYSSLRMPNETAQYVPKLQAVKNIVARPQAFGLTLPELYNHPYFLSVPIERDIDVQTAVRLSGISPDEFQALNPQMNRPVILASGTPQVLLPYDNANRFVRELPRHRGPLATWTAWTAPRTMRPSEAAGIVGMSEETLREVNGINGRMLIKSGSTLVVPRGNQLLADVSSRVADTAMLALAPDVPPARRTTLRAGRRDTLASIARRYQVTAEQVAEWNDLSPKAALRPGQTVVVYVPTRARPRIAQTPQTAPARSVRNVTTRVESRPSARQATRTERSDRGAVPIARERSERRRR